MIRFSAFLVQMIIRAIIARAVARLVMWFMPMIVRRLTQVGGVSMVIEGLSFTDDPTIPKNERGPSDHSPVHPLDSIESVHELPHAPG